MKVPLPPPDPDVAPRESLPISYGPDHSIVALGYTALRIIQVFWSASTEETESLESEKGSEDGLKTLDGQEGVGPYNLRDIWTRVCRFEELRGREIPNFNLIATEVKRLAQQGFLVRSGTLGRYVYKAAMTKAQYREWTHQQFVRYKIAPFLKKLGLTNVVMAMEALGYKVEEQEK